MKWVVSSLVLSTRKVAISAAGHEGFAASRLRAVHCDQKVEMLDGTHAHCEPVKGLLHDCAERLAVYPSCLWAMLALVDFVQVCRD